jgi:hypothetical protein
MTFAGRLAIPAGLLLVLGCGGGGNPPPPVPTVLAYTDPAGDGWRLVRNPESTDQHLVLDLVPPAAVPGGRGVVLELDLSGTGAAWAPVAAGNPALVRNGSVYDLGTGVQALAARVRGTALRLVVAEKGRSHPVPYTGAPVLSVALEAVPAVVPVDGSTLAIGVARAYHLPLAGGKVDMTGQILTGSIKVQATKGQP